MTDSDGFLDTNPGFGAVMQGSLTFAQIKDQAALELGGQRVYIVRGDTLGTEADLFLESVVRGAQRDDPADPFRALYLELDDELRARVDERVKGSGDEPVPPRSADGETKGAMG